MGLNATISHAIAGTIASSSQANANWDALNNASQPTFTKVNLATGSITRSAKFTGSGNGTFSHGLGTTPDIVEMISTQSGVPQSFEVHTKTSTQVTITASGSSQTWEAWAIAFT